jgi:ubiquinone/menaquinone biosynthesis C-methylase UbiE
MEPISRVQAAYDRIAAEYRRVNVAMPLDLAALTQEMVHLAGSPAHILDIGCGHGRDMAWFEAHGMWVTGVDLSVGMLVQARQFVTGELLMMDMRNLAFQSTQFDGAWCCASLLHLPKREVPSALKEIRRILKWRGVLVLTIQEGSGEGWETGYGEGVERFFARYDEQEMKPSFPTAALSFATSTPATWATALGLPSCVWSPEPDSCAL